MLIWLFLSHEQQQALLVYGIMKYISLHAKLTTVQVDIRLPKTIYCYIWRDVRVSCYHQTCDLLSHGELAHHENVQLHMYKGICLVTVTLAYDVL